MSDEMIVPSIVETRLTDDDDASAQIDAGFRDALIHCDLLPSDEEDGA